MAVIPLEYQKHWEWAHYRGDPYSTELSRYKLNPEIHKWLSVHKVRHTIMSSSRHELTIVILDNNQAMLFKLTWL